MGGQATTTAIYTNSIYRNSVADCCQWTLCQREAGSTYVATTNYWAIGVLPVSPSSSSSSAAAAAAAAVFSWSPTARQLARRGGRCFDGWQAISSNSLFHSHRLRRRWIWLGRRARQRARAVWRAPAGRDRRRGGRDAYVGPTIVGDDCSAHVASRCAASSRPSVVSQACVKQETTRAYVTMNERWQHD